ncbi:hypothetical protein [Halomonas gemina]
MINDTSIRKRGPRSVDLSRQYYGKIDKYENLQVALSLSTQIVDR